MLLSLPGQGWVGVKGECECGEQGPLPKALSILLAVVAPHFLRVVALPTQVPNLPLGADSTHVGQAPQGAVCPVVACLTLTLTHPPDSWPRSLLRWGLAHHHP